MSALRYRPDIDGLRAIAVLSVILFHAGVPFLSGGFVGVDVFFVISGFLITSLILKDLEQGGFSFAGFWERRARRILPALAAVIFSTVAAGWFLLLSEDYAALGNEVAAQSVFASNILFYKQAGYFDKEAMLKPLLHTWSLAVEEQFYLLYPLALYAVFRLWRARILSLLLAAAGVMFILCIAMTKINSELAFYMLPFRGWELLAGAIVALAVRRPASFSPQYAGILSMASLAAIMLPVALYTDKTDFPGVAAFLPVAGAAGLIYIHEYSRTVLSNILSFRPVVFAGLVSYSWYLWHWPVMVFVRYIQPAWPTLWIIGGCVVGSFMLAVVTWAFIEKPFREKRLCRSRLSMAAFSFAVLILLCCAGLYLSLSNGAPQRLPDDVVRYSAGVNDSNPRRDECNKTPVEKVERDDVCQTLDGSTTPPDFILWGDSHADAIAPLFYDLSQKYKRNGYILTHHGCEAILGIQKSSWPSGSGCRAYNDAVFALIKRKQIKTVFLVSSYDLWMVQNFRNPHEATIDGAYPKGYETMVGAGLAKTIDALRAMNVRVYLMMEAPSAPFDPPRVLAMDSLLHRTEKRAGIPRSLYLESRVQLTNPFLDRYGRNKMVILDPVDILCPEDTCLYEKDGYSLYYNKGHLSTRGAAMLSPLFEPYFKRGF